MALQHFILTRFNIASSGREARIRTRDGWLDQRFALFEKYCLASVTSQSDGDFEWLIYFDASTPPEYRNRLDLLRAQFSFEPLFIQDFSAQMAKSDVAERIRPGTDRLLTTRLDNDDAIATDFVEQLRREARASKDSTLLSFPRGYSLKGKSLFEARDLANPFISLLEDIDDFRTVWFDQHQQMLGHWPVRTINSRAWVQVVHGANVSNRLKGKLVQTDNPLTGFAKEIAARVVKPKRSAVVIDHFVLFPLRWIREQAIKAVKALT